MKIKNHRIEGIQYVPTKKKGPGRITPKFIVMHYTAGWTTAGDVHTLAQSTRKVSAHLVLGRDGELVQIVPFNDRAWHAGPSRSHGYSALNAHSIGIEICNAGWVQRLSNGNYKDQYGNLIAPDGQFIGSDRKTETPPETWHREHHSRLARGVYVWEPYTKMQLDTLDVVVETLLAKYPTIRWIVSHEEIDTREWKTDPGPMFPMRRYLKFLESREEDWEEGRVKRFLVTASSLKVRKKPSGTVIGALERGTEVAEVDNDGLWKLVEFTQSQSLQSGWVYADYLRLV